MKSKARFNLLALVILSFLILGASPPQDDGISISNLYEKGWCTWWAAERAEQLGWGELPDLENAILWDNNGPSEGFVVDDVPRGGSIVVFEGYPYDSRGHVGFVEWIEEDGTLWVSESNNCEQKPPLTKPTCPKETWELDEPSEWSRKTHQAGMTYIYPKVPIVYEHANYRGRWSPFPSQRVDYEDLYIQDFRYPEGIGQEDMGDKISSVWIPPGWSIELREDKNFIGNWNVLDHSVADFAQEQYASAGKDMNDSVSSLKCAYGYCLASGFGGIMSQSILASLEAEGPPVGGQMSLAANDVTAQAYSGICATGPSNPSTPPGAPGQPDHTQWRVSYYNNEGTAGSPVATGTDGTGGISHNWGTGSPASGVNADSWSARWEREVYFRESGDWKFTIRSDDGFRLFVDGQMLAQEWWEGWHDISPSKYLTAGSHSIRLDYFDHTGEAQVSLSWNPPSVPDGNHYGNWYAQWYDWDNLDPARLRGTSWENQINYNWGTGSPGHGLPADNFSVRWRGTFYFADDWFYKFPVRSDDGFRLKIDGQVIGQEWSEGWHDVAPDARLYGNHEVILEYFEKWGDAKVELSWFRLPDDTDDPTGRIVSPVDGTTINANQLQVCAEVDDGAGLGVKQVEIIVEDPSMGQHFLGKDTDPRDGWCRTWDHSAYPDGRVIAIFLAWDKAGNLGSGDGSTIWIDRTAPSVNFASPSAGSTQEDTMSVRVNANDNLSNGVDRVSFEAHYNAGNNNVGWWPLLVDSDGSDGWGFDWNISDLPTQQINIRATAFDKAGNSRTTEVGNISINPRGPAEYITVNFAETTRNPAGLYDVFEPGEVFRLVIGATNHTTWPIDTLWTWETRGPDGQIVPNLSWSDWPVSMTPAFHTWWLTRTAPETTGTYTFKGVVTWGNGAYRSEKTKTFRVGSGSTIYLPIIVR